MRPPPTEGIAEVIVAKQRNGPTSSSIRLALLDRFAHFANMARV